MESNNNQEALSTKDVDAVRQRLEEMNIPDGMCCLLTIRSCGRVWHADGCRSHSKCLGYSTRVVRVPHDGIMYM